MHLSNERLSTWMGNGPAPIAFSWLVCGLVMLTGTTSFAQGFKNGGDGIATAPFSTPLSPPDEFGSPDEKQAVPPEKETKLEGNADYNKGFVISRTPSSEGPGGHDSFQLKINGWAQLRQTVFTPSELGRELDQLQLKRARLVFSGHAFTTDLKYFVQLDGRSSDPDSLRFLDYYFSYDMSGSVFGCSPETIGFRAGLFKIPLTLARQVSGREMQFADRSVSSIYFDANRSLGWEFFGTAHSFSVPVDWQLGVFNGLQTGGVETGNNGLLDNHHAVAGRVQVYPRGEWGDEDLTDLEWHDELASRVGGGFATSTVDRSGPFEFSSLRTVDAGVQVSTLLADGVHQYDVSLFSIDASFKYRGISQTFEYYFRTLDEFRGGVVPDLNDHGFWLQNGYFVLPEKLELISRWSRVVGNSASLGLDHRSSDEITGGLVWYFRGQNAKLSFDATHLNGAPIASTVLDIKPGDDGWLYRTQLQISF